MVEDDGHAAVAGDEPVPQSRQGAVAREYVHVLPDDANSAVLCDEATIVGSPVGDVARKPGELGDVDGGAEWDDGAVHGDGEQRRDGLASGAAAPWESCRIEHVEADLLPGAGAHVRAGAIAFGEADGRSSAQGAATLHAEALEEGPWNLRDGLALAVPERDARPRELGLARKIVVRIAKGPEGAARRLLRSRTRDVWFRRGGAGFAERAAAKARGSPRSSLGTGKAFVEELAPPIVVRKGFGDPRGARGATRGHEEGHRERGA